MDRRGTWEYLLVGLIIALVLLAILIIFWAKQGGGIADFLAGLFGAAPSP